MPKFCTGAAALASAVAMLALAVGASSAKELLRLQPPNKSGLESDDLLRTVRKNN